MIGRSGSRAVRFVLAVVPFVLLVAPSARAAEPTLTTRELGSFPDALAALRGDLGGEGRTLHVSVHAGGSRVACDHYQLDLDPAARAAFRVGACDPATEETSLVLEHRAELFDHDAHVPRPRTLSITAVVTHQGTVVAGGGPQGGSALRCSWALRPYLDDLEHGTRVLLTPEHYALRSGSAWVTATPDGAGWSLSTTEGASFHLEYEVVDRATGAVVLRQALTLRCGPEPTPERAPSPLSSPRHRALVAPPVPARVRLPATPAKPEIYTMAGIFTVVWAALAAPCFVYAARADDAGARVGPAIGGTVMGALAVATGAAFFDSVYQVRKASRPLRLGPTASASGRGAALGLAGSF